MHEAILTQPVTDEAVVVFIHRLDGEMDGSLNVELRKLSYAQLLVLARSLAGYEATQGNSDHCRITVREREVLALIASRKSSRQIAKHFGIAFRTVVCHRFHIQAIQTAARDHPFHPVKTYLNAIQWDGIERLDRWLSMYLGAEDTEYSRAVRARWLISAIARIFRPGAKADCCLILEGPQGIRKSTALRILAGEYFTDELADLGSKDAAMQTRGVWIIELSELDSLSNSDVARIKAFMNRTTDRFRPPYGMRLVESPRQCVFAGTVNHSTYLRDETGGRRFWPVTCGRIRIDELSQDRDQLWAEANVRFTAGAPWWLETAELVHMAADQQIERYEGDPWEEVIGPWLEARSSTSISEILERCLQKPQGLWNQADKNRAARCLRALAWERYRERNGSRLEWRYRKQQ